MNLSTQLKKRWCNQREIGRAVAADKRLTPKETTALLHQHGLLTAERQLTTQAIESGCGRLSGLTPTWLAEDDPRKESYGKRIQWHQEKTLAYLQSRGVVLASMLEQRAQLICDQLSVSDGHHFKEEGKPLDSWQRSRFEEHMAALELGAEDKHGLMIRVAELLESQMGVEKTTRCLKDLGWNSAIRARKLEDSLPEPAARAFKPRF